MPAAAAPPARIPLLGPWVSGTEVEAEGAGGVASKADVASTSCNQDRHIGNSNESVNFSTFCL